MQLKLDRRFYLCKNQRKSYKKRSNHRRTILPFLHGFLKEQINILLAAKDIYKHSPQPPERTKFYRALKGVWAGANDSRKSTPADIPQYFMSAKEQIIFYLISTILILPANVHHQLTAVISNQNYQKYTKRSF